MSVDLAGLQGAAAPVKTLPPEKPGTGRVYYDSEASQWKIVAAEDAQPPQAPPASSAKFIYSIHPAPGFCRGCFLLVQRPGRVAGFCLTCAPPGLIRRSWTAFTGAWKRSAETFSRAAQNTADAFVTAAAAAMISIDRSIDEGRAASVRKRWKASRKRALKSRAAIANAMGILEGAKQWRTTTTVTAKLDQAQARLDAASIQAMLGLTKAIASGLSTTEAIKSLKDQSRQCGR